MIGPEGTVLACAPYGEEGRPCVTSISIKRQVCWREGSGSCGKRGPLRTVRFALFFSVQTMPISVDDVRSYYDSEQATYSRYWSPTALHYGFWYDDTTSLAEAILNTDKFIVDALEIKSKDVVLDAGCGVGGTTQFIAETTGARLEGITLSPVQLKIAIDRTAGLPASDHLRFSLQDYSCTAFHDATFSKVFAIESACHASNKLGFLLEAYRLMKPGGRIAIVDFFLAGGELSAASQKLYADFLDGWVLPGLATCEQFTQLLSRTGFVNITFSDMLRYVWPSIERIDRISLLAYPLHRIKAALGLARKDLAARHQKRLFRRGIISYGVFVAVKPKMA